MRAEGGDFYFVDASDAEDGVRKLLAIARERIPKRFRFDAVRDIQVLCPMNRGGLGARSLNIELQRELNPPRESRIERFAWTFCPGEKVMQVENDYDRDVYNGDLGVVSRIDLEDCELVADFDGREVTYGFVELEPYNTSSVWETAGCRWELLIASHPAFSCRGSLIGCPCGAAQGRKPPTLRSRE
jgi:exodeoxyribonuclease V alpha subunit